MKTLRFAVVALFLALLLLPLEAHQPGTFSATECFPFERLPVGLRSRAEETLLKAFDGEALRQVLDAWTCGGELAAGVHHFARIFEGRRALEAVVFHRPALRALLARQRTIRLAAPATSRAIRRRVCSRSFESGSMTATATCGRRTRAGHGRLGANAVLTSQRLDRLDMQAPARRSH